MREKVRNTFVKGMDQDRAFTRYDSEKYLRGLNVRPTTDELGSSTASLASVQGNALNFSIPDTGNVWRFTVSSAFVDAFLDGTTKSITISIGGVSSQLTFTTTEVQAFYEILSNFINGGAYGSLPIESQYKEAGAVIYTTDFSEITSVTSNTSSLLIQEIAQASTDLRIIGSTELRDSIIIFTAPEIPNGSGQVWEVTWDECDAASLDLIRNGAESFSASHPIEAVSRYETNSIRRVYWTDNNNPIRSLNIDSDSTYIDVADIVTAVNFDIPIPVSLSQSGGSLIAGQYSAAYRLKSLGGSTSSYSRFSPSFRIVTDNEDTESYNDYSGVPHGVTSTKSLTFRIDNIDTNFSNIDILIAYSADTTIKYFLIQEDFELVGATSYEFTVSELDASVEIDEAEFLLQPAAFNTAKTLTIKDNRLLAGNLTDTDLSLDNYDANAFRYTASGGIDGHQTTTDKINKYNKDSTRSLISNTQQKFKRNGTLGGEGVNISYEFITKSLDLDIIGGSADTPQRASNDAIRLVINKDAEDQTLNGKDIPLGGLWNNFKNPFFESWYKGYHRSEVYRFGIVFFDLKGRPSTVNWIGDIRMPDANEINTFNQGTGDLQGSSLGLRFSVKVTDDIKSKFTGYSIVRADRPQREKTIIGQGMVGDLEINVLTEGDQSGELIYLQADRFLAYGETNLSPVHHTLNIPEFKFNGYPSLSGTKLRPIVAVTPTLSAVMNAANPNAGNPVDTGKDHGAYGKYYATNAASWYGDNSSTDNTITLSRAVEDELNVGFSELFIEDNDFFDPVPFFLNYQSIFDNGGLHDTATFGDNEVKLRTKCAPTLLVKTENLITTYQAGSRILSTSQISSNGAWLANFIREPNIAFLGTLTSLVYGKKLLVNLYKELTNQYGGNTLSSINNTEYISTGHYQAFSPNDSSTTFVNDVFGGDTYINVYDETTGSANRGNGGATTEYVEADEARMSSCFFVVESSTNIDLREGRHFSTIGNSTVGGSGANVINSHELNDVYQTRTWQNRANDVVKFQSLSSFRNNNSQFENRVYASDPKINGEPGDSWTSFKALNFIDVDGNHGPINKLITFNDNVLFFQDRGFGNLSVNPRIAVQGSDDVQIELGVGGILHDFNYYSTTIGTKHQWSVFQSPHAVYWFNILNRKVYRYYGQGADELVDMKGMHSFFNSSIDSSLVELDNPLLDTGVIGAYDFLNQEVMFTFLGQHKEKDNFTIAYSELIDAWSSFYSFLPNIYLQNQLYLLSPNPADKNNIFLHNKGEYLNFYDQYANVELGIVVNPKSDATKVFDNISFHTNARNKGGFSIDQKTFEGFDCYSDYQHSGPILLSPDQNLKRKEREWQMAVPRNAMSEGSLDVDLFDPANYDLSKSFKDRMRDKYLVANFSLLGTEEVDQFIINYINTYYRVSAR